MPNHSSGDGTSVSNPISWGVNHEVICAAIARQKSHFKIVLKTYNDPIFLDRWITHHSHIVGTENLIIADNESNDDAVLQVYSKYGKELLAFSFHGNHDELQVNRTKWAQFWNALSDSCTYLLFLDTDEFLVSLEGNQWNAGMSIVDRLKQQSELEIIPTYLLGNSHLMRDDVFSLDPVILLNSLQWGKPIMRSPFYETEGYIHNSQSKLRFWSPNCPATFFLLHLDQVYPEQRRRAILASMVKFGDVDENTTLQTIDLEWVSKSNRPRLKRYANQLKRLQSMQASSESNSQVSDQRIFPGCITLNKNGMIDFHDQQDKLVLHSFTMASNPLFRAATLFLNSINLLGDQCSNSMQLMNAIRSAYASPIDSNSVLENPEVVSWLASGIVGKRKNAINEIYVLNQFTECFDSKMRKLLVDEVSKL